MFENGWICCQKNSTNDNENNEREIIKVDQTGPQWMRRSKNKIHLLT